MGKYDFASVCERIARLEVDNGNQLKKINEIHKVLVGNGQPGLVAEWNQWKGGARLFGIVLSTLVTCLGIAVTWMAVAA